MECPTCHFVATPGQAAVAGACPNCNRPYRDQPTPLNSDMAMRNMPEPGMEDSGGNPLQEGILGDYQNRGVRDESYASVKKSERYQPDIPDYPPVPQSSEVSQYGHEQIQCPQCGSDLDALDMNFETGVEKLRCGVCGFEGEDTMRGGIKDPLEDKYKYHDTVEHPLGPHTGSEQPEFEVTDVLVPDPDSIREDKEQMEKQADFMDTLGDIGQVAAPVAGGVAGFALGGPAGAALGAGLAGGGMSALNGGNVGDIAQTGLTDAALGGLGGFGAGALGATSLGAGEAAGMGATRGGVGSLMKSALGKIPTQQLQRAYMTHSLLNDASQMGQQQMTPSQPSTPAPALPTSYYSHTADVETPSSQGHIPSNDTSDPEQVDFHEKNDGSHEDPLSQIDINGIGGTDLGPDDFFDAESGAFAQFATLLPKILDYALGDKSAAGDPDIEDLHSKLEAEKPGYLDGANDAHGEKIILFLGGGNGETQSDDHLQDNDEPHDPIAEHEATALAPGLEQTCPNCGGVMDASNGHCPQCSNPNMMANPQPTNPDFTSPQQMVNPQPAQDPTMPRIAGGQGPNSPEQQAAVAELLQQEGRAEEVPTMLLEPWQYADELAQISGQEQPPESIGQEGPPPPVTPPSQEAQMPVPGMSAPSPGAGGSPMMAAIAKHAGTVPGLAESCPNCGSHSTGYMDPTDGKLGCKSCGHHWTGPKLIERSSAERDWERGGDEGGEAAPRVPDVEGEGSEDMEEADPQGSHTWIDSSGTPLQVGQTYSMYSENYDIPDQVHIDAVKPDVVEYTIVGEYGLDHRSELTHEEAQLEHLSFVPAAEGEVPPVQPETENMEDVARPAPGEVTDSSTPHELMASRTADFDDINGPQGPNVNPEPQQPESINLEPNWDGMKMFVENMARTDLNQAIKVNLEMGSYRVDPIDLAAAARVSPEEVEQLEHELGGIGALPETQHPLGPMTGSSEEEPEEHGPTWLKEDDSNDLRTAGAKMTPWEQRDYIDEMGDARNSDKLSLGGTHYEMDDISESFLWGT